MRISALPIYHRKERYAECRTWSILVCCSLLTSLPHIHLRLPKLKYTKAAIWKQLSNPWKLLRFIVWLLVELSCLYKILYGHWPRDGHKYGLRGHIPLIVIKNKSFIDFQAKAIATNHITKWWQLNGSVVLKLEGGWFT